MGIELPPELAQVAQATGTKWPQADEDKMRQQAGAYRDAAGKLGAVSGDADAAAHGALTSFQGSAADAARGHWDTFVAPDTGHLPATVAGCHQAADRLDHAADQIGSAKVEMVRQLTNAAKTSDAAHHAAAAGFPGALAGLNTTIQGAATNVAAVHGNLAQAVRLDSGVTTRDSALPVGPGGRGHQPGLLGGVDDTARGVTGGAGAAVHGATSMAGGSGGAGGLTGFGSDAGPGGHGLGGPDPTHGGPVADLGAMTGHAGQDGTPGWPGLQGGQVGGPFGGSDHHTGPVQLPGTGYGGDPNSPASPAGHGDQAPIGVMRASAGVVEPAVAPSTGLLDSGNPGGTPGGQVGGANPGGGTQLSFGGGYAPDSAGSGGVAGGTGGGVAGGSMAGGGGRGAGGIVPGQRPPQQFGGPGGGPGTGFGGTASPRPGGGVEGFVGAVGGGPGQHQRQPGRPGAPGGRAEPVAPDLAGGHSKERPAKPSSEAFAFLMYLFPLGQLPVPASTPARQLPAPTAEFSVPGGLRFAPQDHPQADLVDDTPALRAARAGAAPVRQWPGAPADHPAVIAAGVGHDPLGGEHERDWDRRFLVRPAESESGRRAEYSWPPPELFPEGGCAPEATEAVVLDPGTEIDRFGDPEGRVLAEAGTSFAARSLPPEHRDHGYHRYRVRHPLPVWRTVSAAWFGQHGGAVRYRTTYPVAELVAFGYLDPVEPPVPSEPAAPKPQAAGVTAQPTVEPRPTEHPSVPGEVNR